MSIRFALVAVLVLLLTASPPPAMAQPGLEPPLQGAVPPRSCPAGTVAYAIHQVKRSSSEIPTVGGRSAGRESSLFILTRSLDELIARHLRQGYQFITYGDLYDQAYDPSRPCMLLSEDDGHLDFYLNGFPIALEHGIRMTIFVNSSSANGVRAFATWEQLQEMIDSGLIDVEAHGALHEDFTAVSRDRLRFLLTEGKAAIEHRLWKPNADEEAEPDPWEVRFVAYPRGLVDARVVEEVRRAGYVGGVALQPRGDFGWYGLRRVYPR